MRTLLQLIIFAVVAWFGLRLMTAVVTYRDADVWIKQGAERQHLKGDVSYPLSGGVQVRSPDGNVSIYPQADVAQVSFKLQPYTGQERLKLGAIVLGVLVVWVLISWREIVWAWTVLGRWRTR